MESQLELYDDIRTYVAKYHEEVPRSVEDGYSAYQDETYQDGALSRKVKRLIALGIALRAGCTACILSQAKQAVEAGASKEEITEAVAVAVAMSGSTAVGWSWRVFKLLEELGK